ncbi:hypothetical protein L202_06608 [Cryptococcus amylolentus CBS 6039]|uniref:CCHC-type domain-containing protein n=2 Tax=Cryptococcus amylolentus TaxID=104669 RepID=A0A1E3HH71_9TREE|nr:hypothetical protein L202_06608 [Cryptococcus amylolentus CBS 6039]ODN75475.1 hypothetical protein L202_06608 [Cryptococcus amylolentus CBS 6039]ODO03190.1 hypothetical protein I350_06035 [Cryptococcus amylolentus CBS 6273]
MNDNKPNKPKNADGTKNAEGTSPSKPHSVVFDEDGNAITSADATSRPIGHDHSWSPPSCCRRHYPSSRRRWHAHRLQHPASSAARSYPQGPSFGRSDVQSERWRAQVDPPKLPMLSSSCASQLGVVRHLHDLQRYFVEYNSRSPDGTPSAPQWRVARANKSIAKVDEYHYWSIVTGAACVSWEAWRDEFKKQALSPNWESETRRVFEGLQCQGSTLTAWQTFEKKAGECQMLLFGLPSHILTRVEDRLDDRGLSRSAISLPLLHDIIDRIFRTTELPAPPPATYTRQFRQSSATTSRPSAPSNVPNPSPVPPAQLNGRSLTAEEVQWINKKKLSDKSTNAGACARAFPDRNDLCYWCRKAGHKSRECSARETAATVANLSIDDLDEDGDVFAAMVEHDIDCTDASSVPLILVDVGLSADSPITTGLIDPGAASILMDVFIGPTLYKNSSFLIIPTSRHVDFILGLPFCLQHRLLEGAARLAKLMAEGRSVHAQSQYSHIGSLTVDDPSLQPTVVPSPHRQQRAEAIRADFADVLPNDIGNVDNYPEVSPTISKVRHRIDILPGVKPVARSGFRVPLAWKEAFFQEIEKHRRAGRLHPSSSPWAAPAFLL